MSSGFISETELAQRRRVRQEEWEKVRRPDQPLEAPEEEYDHRSLYERLQEQKQKKEFEYEEAHRLKNMIKGLDDDEVEFLDLVDRSKLEEERKKTAEEEREMADFRNKVASLQEKGLEDRIQQEIKRPLKANNKIPSGRSSQTKLLAGAVVKKRSLEQSPELKAKSITPESPSKTQDSKRMSIDSASEITGRGQKRTIADVEGSSPLAERHGSLKCIGILPGLGTYAESSEEENSDDSSEVDEGCHRYDLLGRRIESSSSSESAQAARGGGRQ